MEIKANTAKVEVEVEAELGKKFTFGDSSHCSYLCKITWTEIPENTLDDILYILMNQH